MSEKKRKEGTFGKSVRNLILQLEKNYSGFICFLCRFNAGGSCVIFDGLSHWTCRIVLTSWWDGLSNQFTLAFQMGLMVVVCATCALEAHRFQVT